MKLIFLDIDGVMNHKDYFVRSRLHELQEFCPVAVRNLREIIKRTGAHIVLSSTWRLGRNMIDIRLLFSCYDLDRYVIGKTPVLDGKCRGEEIKQLLIEIREPVESFVILDDDSDMGDMLPRLVQCKDFSGLQDRQREEAIAMLSIPFQKELYFTNKGGIKHVG